jgi:uncharacterized delta-60 repeat protein
MFTPFAFIQPITTSPPITPATQYLLIGGQFTSYNIPNVNRIAKIDTNGDLILNSSFNVGLGFNNVVYDIKQQPDKKYITVGVFATYNSIAAQRVARLNQDGTRDTTLTFGTVNQSPRCVVTQPDNSNIIVGDFTTFSGSVSNYIVKITPSGSIDSSFNIGTGFNNQVYAAVTQSDGKITAIGEFTLYSGSAVNRIVRINTNGTRDTTFNIGTGFSVGSADIRVQPDNKILVVGNFSSYSGSAATRIVRINTDGTIDNSFVSGVGFNVTPHSLDLQPDGKILVLGSFTSYSGSANNYIIRLNTNGTIDNTFNIGTGISAISSGINNAKILSIANNKVMVTAPLVTTYSGSTSGNIFRINSNGTLDTAFNSISSNTFNSTGLGFSTNFSTPSGYSMIMSGSDVIVVGNFITYKSPVMFRGGMVDLTGDISQSFNIGGGVNNTIRTWATQSDGKILAGGEFTQYSGSTTNASRIVRLNLNGNRDTTFNIGTGFNSNVFNLNVQSDDKIIAIGAFTTYSGSAVNGIVRINTNGTIDNTFNVGTGFQTTTQANHSTLQSDGKIVVVGAFTLYSGSSVNRIVRINTNGTRDTTFNIGTGFPTQVEAVLTQSDGKIVVTGTFTVYSGSSVDSTRIIRINTNGTRDTTFVTGDGLNATGIALAQQSDGKIISANLASTYSGSTAGFLIRINTNGTLDTTFGFYPPASGLSLGSGVPNALKIDNNGRIYYGNSFTSYSGSVPNRIVRLNTNGSVDQTFNQSFPNFINDTGKGADFTVNALLLI